MKEIIVRQRFEKLLNKRMMEKKIPYAYYKIPDTKELGGKKPYDSFLLVTGKFIAIEFKKKGEKPTAYQRYNLDKVKTCGGAALIIDETNYKMFIDRIIFGAEISLRQMKHMGFTIADRG